MSALGRARAAAIVMAGLALPCLPTPAYGQDLAITGGTVHTVAGDVLDGVTVLIQDGRIAAVGADVSVPEGIRSIDASGYVVTPGLFDAATSLGLVEVGSVSSSVDSRMGEDVVRAAFDVVDGINPRSVLIPINRSSGITTALAAPSGGLISGQAAVIDLAGATADEMLVKARAAMLASHGPGAARPVGGARGAVSLRLREVLDDALWWSEHRADYDVGRSRELSYSRLDLEALGPVLEGRIPLIVAVNRASDITAVLRIADEYDLAVVIAGAAEGWIVADQLAAAAVPVIVKPLTNGPGGFDRLGSRFDNAALMHEAGVRLVISSFSTHNARNITLEAGNAVRFGLPWAEALRAVTLAPATVLGLDRDYGSVEVGKEANLVVWSGDPFELSSRAEAVVIRGQEVPIDSRQKALLRRYRDLSGERPAFLETGP